MSVKSTGAEEFIEFTVCPAYEHAYSDSGLEVLSVCCSNYPLLITSLRLSHYPKSDYSCMFYEISNAAVVRPLRQGLLQGRLLLRQPQRPANDVRRDGLRRPSISQHHLQRLRSQIKSSHQYYCLNQLPFFKMSIFKPRQKTMNCFKLRKVFVMLSIFRYPNLYETQHSVKRKG